MCWLSLPILVFLGLSVLDLGPMYATDRRQTKASLNAPAYWDGGIIRLLLVADVKLRVYQVVLSLDTL